MEGYRCKDASVIHVIDMRDSLFITATSAERTLVELIYTSCSYTVTANHLEFGVQTRVKTHKISGSMDSITKHINTLFQHRMNA